MGELHNLHNKDIVFLPMVLLVGPPGNLGFLKPKQHPQKYKISSPWKPSLVSLHQFMAENHYDPSNFEALICWAWGPPINSHILQILPSLKLVITTNAGTDHIDLKECHRRGIQVANVGTLFSEDVADMAVALLISVLTKISSADQFFRTKNQHPTRNFPFPSTPKLRGKRVGIIGLGSIGMEVAKRLEAFGCIILYLSRNQNSFVSYSFYSNIIKLASTSDALVLSCPLNNQTRHIVNKEVMLALGKKGVIVNVGRGAIIDEKELVKCLKEGHIGGAGLDVFENEPNVPKELLGMDNVVLSPHNASFTTETYVALAELVTDNLEAFFTKKPLITPVNLDLITH